MTIRSRYRRFKRRYDPRYPALFFTLDAAIFGLKMIPVVLLFGAIFYWAKTL